LAEHGLSSALEDLPEEELRLWQLVNKVNLDGVHCDVEAAEASVETMAVLKTEAEKELFRLTGGAVETVNQGARIIAWASEQGYTLANCQKDTILDALRDDDCPDLVKEVLRIRQQFGRSSISKYQAILSRVDRTDNRVREHIRYCGAGQSGRLSGQGLQTQNFPRPDKGISFEQTLLAIRAVKTRDPEFFASLFENPAAMLSAAIRPTICASPGSTLYCIDYSSIEAVLTLWFCGDPGIELIKQGLCIYRDLAGEIYNIDDPQSLPKKSDERQHGKVGVLGGGYGMSWKKLQFTTKKQWDIWLPDDLAKRIITAYRSRYPMVVKMWKRLQNAFLSCVWNKKDVKVAHGVEFFWGDPFVKIKLPSGRFLYRYKPTIHMELAPWGAEVPGVRYWQEDSQTKKWKQKKTYGGKILNWIIQSMARDLMCSAALEVDKFPELGRLVMSVHDELVYEILKKLNPEEACKRTCEIMTRLPDWLNGCPVGVEAWVGKEYRK
jgi:DNA polymerase